jgi:hypothetical protein
MFNQSTSLQVPFLNFTTLSFAAPLMADILELDSSDFNYETQIYIWSGPSQVVKKITALVTVQGVILPLTPPSPNSSWHLEFWGPSLKCGHVDDARRQRIENNIATYFSTGTPCFNDRPLYLSWFQDLPYDKWGWSGLDIETGSNATITIAAFPGMHYVLCDSMFSNLSTSTNQSSANSINPLGNGGEGSTMIQCQLFNSTYKADFVYLESSQSIAVNAPVKSSDKPFTTFQSVSQKISSDNTLSGCIYFNDNVSTLTLPCDFNPAILPVIAYQAVLEAFTSVLSGTVIDPFNEEIKSNSSILSTTLVDTKELAFLNNLTAGYSSVYKNQTDLRSSLAKLGKMDVSGFPEANGLTSNRSLSDVLEEMFRNLTISLMSSDLLR